MCLAACVSIATPLGHLSAHLSSSCYALVLRFISLCLCTCLFVYLSHHLFVIYLHIYTFLSCTCPAIICLCLHVYLSICASIAPLFAIYLHYYLPVMHSSCGHMSFVYLSQPPLCHLSPRLSCCHALVPRPYVSVDGTRALVGTSSLLPGCDASRETWREKGGERDFNASCCSPPISLRTGQSVRESRVHNTELLLCLCMRKYFFVLFCTLFSLFLKSSVTWS
jgi:hypothetical protein